METKIKISAPRQNPHICYISSDYKPKISVLKAKLGLSTYALLTECSNANLSTAENIRAFKQSIKKKGYRNIGQWAEDLIDFLYDNMEDLESIDLKSIELHHKED